MQTLAIIKLCRIANPASRLCNRSALKQRGKMLKEHKQRLQKLVKEAGISLSHIEAIEKGLVYSIRLKHSPVAFILKQQPNNYDKFTINYTLELFLNKVKGARNSTNLR